MNGHFTHIDSIQQLLADALREDIGGGDITTLSVIPEGTEAAGSLIAKEDGVLCGVEIIERVYGLLGGGVTVSLYKKDGDLLVKGDVIADLGGDARTLLSGERVILNVMQHMSGIATSTKRAVCAVAGTSARIVDTRKTTPLMRQLEKYAVRVGGGSNHRFALYDGVLIKDNHIAAAGGITNAVRAAKAMAPHTIKIEVEVETVEQAMEALESGADIIMLDNMDEPTMKHCVELIGGRALTEASGNMGQRDLLSVAKTGVDLISIGALTHSVKALDISLKFKVKHQ